MRRSSAIMCAHGFIAALLLTSGGVVSAYEDGVLCSSDQIGTLIESTILNFEIDGDRLYVHPSHEGLRIYDISDPESPVLLGTYERGGNLLVDGNRLYIAYDGGIDVVDVSDPSAATSLGHFEGEEFVTFPLHGWTLVGDVIFMANSQAGLLSFDVSEPSAITQLDTYRGFLDVYGVLSAGSYLYVSSGEALEVLDVSDPRSPELVHALGWVGLYERSAVVDSFMYLVDDEGFSVLDISDPSEMVLVGSTGTNFPRGEYREIYVSGGRAYISTDGSVEVFDVVDPSNPAHLGTYIARYASGFRTNGSTGYLASASGLHLVDVSEPGTPLVGSMDTLGEARSVLVDQGYAYIADDYRNQTSGTNGLRVVDVRDPAHPVLMGSVNIDGPTRNLDKENDLVYTADGYFGFHVIDVSLPGSATIIGGFDTDRDAIDLAVQNGIVYVADEHSLRVFDANDPSDINPLSSLSLNATAVLVRDTIVFVVENQIGVHAFDISDPSELVLLGSYLPEHFYAEPDGYGLELVDDELFIVGEGFGIIRLDISDPSQIQLISSQDGFHQLHHGVFVKDRIAYVVEDRFGLMLVDLDEPVGSSVIGSYHVPWGASDVYVVDDYAYVVDGNGGGMHIVNISNGCGGCFGDFNDDGVLNFFDATLFIHAFISMDPVSDLNNDGQFDFFDVSVFLNAIGAGCP